MRAIVGLGILFWTLTACQHTHPAMASVPTHSLPSASPKSCTAGITVATFNTAGLNRLKIPKYRSERIRLQQHHLPSDLADVDVVVFQEVYGATSKDEKANIDHRYDLVEALQASFTAAAIPDELEREKKFEKTGLMIFARTDSLKIEATHWHELSQGSWPRGLLCADLERIVDGTEYRVCTVHLTPMVILKRMRKNQVEKIVKFNNGSLAPFDFDGTIVLAGDFNLAPSFDFRPDQTPSKRLKSGHAKDTCLYHSLTEVFTVESQVREPTLTHLNLIWGEGSFGRKEADRRVDLIFVENGSLTDSKVFLNDPKPLGIGAIPLSDHLGLRACVSTASPSQSSSN